MCIPSFPQRNTWHLSFLSLKSKKSHPIFFSFFHVYCFSQANRIVVFFAYQVGCEIEKKLLYEKLLSLSLCVCTTYPCIFYTYFTSVHIPYLLMHFLHNYHQECYKCYRNWKLFKKLPVKQKEIEKKKKHSETTTC